MKKQTLKEKQEITSNLTVAAKKAASMLEGLTKTECDLPVQNMLQVITELRSAVKAARR